jgi:hypothetical protein
MNILPLRTSMVQPDSPLQAKKPSPALSKGAVKNRQGGVVVLNPKPLSALQNALDISMDLITKQTINPKHELSRKMAILFSDKANEHGFWPERAEKFTSKRFAGSGNPLPLTIDYDIHLNTVPSTGKQAVGITLLNNETGSYKHNPYTDVIYRPVLNLLEQELVSHLTTLEHPARFVEGLWNAEHFETYLKRLKGGSSKTGSAKPKLKISVQPKPAPPSNAMLNAFKQAGIEPGTKSKWDDQPEPYSGKQP